MYFVILSSGPSSNISAKRGALTGLENYCERGGSCIDTAQPPSSQGL
jgi:hypothetical protein